MLTKGQVGEEIVRRYLEDRFDQQFSKQKLPVKGESKTERREFDLVSENRKIVAQVKTYRCPYYPHEMQGVESDLYKLSHVDSEMKLLFLTDLVFYMAFCRKHKADLVRLRKQGVEIVSPLELSNYSEE